MEWFLLVAVWASAGLAFCCALMTWRSYRVTVRQSEQLLAYDAYWRGQLAEANLRLSQIRQMPCSRCGNVERPEA